MPIRIHFGGQTYFQLIPYGNNFQSCTQRWQMESLMESIKTILENSPVMKKLNEPQQSTSEAWESNQSRVILMDECWKELMRLRLVHDRPGSEAFMTFARSLADKSEAQIRHAILRCRDFTGFFTVPAFRELCVPDMKTLGLPTVEIAYYEACNASDVRRHRWSHAAVYHAGADTGWFDLRNCVNDVKRRFKENYERRVQQVLDGEYLELPQHELLPASIRKVLSPEERKSRMQKLREELGV